MKLKTNYLLQTCLLFFMLLASSLLVLAKENETDSITLNFK